MSRPLYSDLLNALFTQEAPEVWTM